MFFTAQVSAPPVPLPLTKPDTLTEWGVWGAIAFFVVKEAFTWFNKKKDQETKLVADLIKNQHLWSDRINERYETTLTVLRDSQLKMSDAVVRSETTLNEMVKLHYREIRQQSLHLIELREELSKTNAVLSELLRRSDKQLVISKISLMTPNSDSA